jgi:type I restriction enzyme S subunit
MEGRELPVGWVEVPIGDLCELRNGRAFKPAEWTDEGIPIVRIQNLNNWQAKFNHYQGEVDANHLLGGGELLFAWSGTPGTSFGAHIWAGGKAALNQHIFRVDFDEVSLRKDFFRYAINQKLNDLIDIAHGGVGLRHVTKGKFEQTEVCLPPLNEQRRIAAKLDTTLAAVDACRQRLDGVAAILKRFRQAVLSAATSGELTREWREENPIDGKWEEGCLHELLSSKPRNGYSPKPADQETPIKSLTLSATTTGRFKPEHFKYIDQSIPVDSHLWLTPGDILIQRANTLEYVGISAIYNGPEKTFIYPDLMMKCRANDNVDTQYLHYLLLSEVVRNYFRESATGTSGNMPKINQQIVMLAPVRWPTHDEQLEIVGRAQELFTLADQLEARLTTARKIVDRLTPALLAKAFRGELVPQDPSDEPASVLLERIRAARQVEAAAGKPSRRGRRKAAINPDQIAMEAAPVPGDFLAGLLRECGALSERALLAVSELEPQRFQQQLYRELESGTAREVQENGQVLLEAVG